MGGNFLSAFSVPVHQWHGSKPFWPPSTPIQVKLRGFRVELREVLDTILAHPAVETGEMLLQGDQLWAFVTPELSLSEVGEVLAHARAVLPSYAVPARIVQLPAFPLNKNGKVDRPALLAAGAAVVAKAAAAAAEAMASAGLGDGRSTNSPPGSSGNLLLDAVTRTWAEVLGMPADAVETTITLNVEGFFAAGGSSLTAIHVSRRLAALLGIDVTIVPVALIFQHQTASEYAAALETELLGQQVLEAVIAHLKHGPGGSLAVGGGLAHGGERGEKEGAASALAQEMQDQPIPWGVFVLCQLLGSLAVLICGAGPAAGALALSLWLVLASPLKFAALPLVPFVWMAGTLVHLILAVALKLVLGGPFREGIYVVRGRTFLVWWLRRRLSSLTRMWLW